MKQKTAFTLIELLVVIAIIAILAAILFPVFAQAREKARQATCTSNIKQLNTAMLMYTQDYDEDFPFWSYANSVACNGPLANAACQHFDSIWFNAVYPYAKNGNILACPDADDHETITQNKLWGWSNVTDLTQVGINTALVNQQVNYGMNEPLQNGTLCGSGNSAGCSQAAIQNVAQTLLLGDCVLPLTGGFMPQTTNPTDPTNRYVLSRVAYSNCPYMYTNQQSSCGAFLNDNGTYTAQPQFDSQARHASGDIVGFADGHAKWLPDSQVIWALIDGVQPQ